MGSPPLGKQESELLHFIADHAPIAMNQAAEKFGEPRNLARTTVLTVMERLRKKGYLSRERIEGIYYYSPTVPKKQLLSSLVSEFVEQRLGGSLQPFIAYLAQEPGLSKEELKKLEQIVETLETRRGGKQP